MNYLALCASFSAVVGLVNLPITVKLKNADGTVLTCPAQAGSVNGTEWTLTGVVCPGDRIFRDGFDK